jgi:hypothetical protein
LLVTWRIYFAVKRVLLDYNCLLASFEVIEMAPPEETLHHYLRRHFEKVSTGNARQFAEQREISELDVVPDTRTSDGSGGYGIAKPPLTHYH